MSEETISGNGKEMDLEKRTEQEILRDKRIEQLREEIRKRNNRIRLNLGLIGILVMVAGAAAVLYRQILFTEENFVLGIMGVVGLLFFSGQIYSSGETDTVRLQADLDKLELDKEVGDRLRARAQLAQPDQESSAAAPSYFDSLVETNVVNLREYYNLVRVHTHNSFRISIYAGLVGFILIAAGLTLGFNADEQGQVVAYISAASGLFVEFISGVFFYLYSRTVRELKAYHDSLLDVQNVLLSLKLIDGAGPEKAPEMIAEMLRFLMERKHESVPGMSKAAEK